METVTLALACVALVLLSLAILTFLIPKWVETWDRYKALRAQRKELLRGDGVA